VYEDRKGADEFDFEIRSEATAIEQDCYGQGIHFERAWAQKWAQFEKLADFWPALVCSKFLI
jgi:hypothetical protein